MAMTRLENPRVAITARAKTDFGSTEKDAARQRSDMERAVIASRALRRATSKGLAVRWLVENW
jgi:hypothetical protein